MWLPPREREQIGCFAQRLETVKLAAAAKAANSKGKSCQLRLTEVSGWMRLGRPGLA
jgi:hypothetical protein